MPAYHSAFAKDCASVCGLAMLPLKTKARGPAMCLDVGAAGAAAGEEDQVDEALRLFRANVLFRNFEVQGAPDRTLIYLTLLIHQVRPRKEWGARRRRWRRRTTGAAGVGRLRGRLRRCAHTTARPRRVGGAGMRAHGDRAPFRPHCEAAKRRQRGCARAATAR